MLVKVKSVGEVEAKSSFRKSSAESVKSIVLPPIRSFWDWTQFNVRQSHGGVRGLTGVVPDTK
jgi:hypothetical protein